MSVHKRELMADSGVSPLVMSNQAEKEIPEEPPTLCSKKNPLITDDKVFNSITVFDLSKKEIEIARTELGETEEVKRNCLRELKRKLLKDGNERRRMDDQYLLRFLRVRKFDYEKVYSCLKKFYDIKRNNPEIFNLHPNLKSVLDLNAVTILPYTDEYGRILFWVDIGKWKPEKVSFEDLFRTVVCIFDIISMNPKCQINGIIGVWDMKEINISHFSNVLKRLQMVLALSLNCYPWRVKKLIIINTGHLTRISYNILRPFLSKKMKDRMFLLRSDFSVLHEHVNPQILPKELGGKLEDEECTISQLVLENLHILQYERSFC